MHNVNVRKLQAVSSKLQKTVNLLTILFVFSFVFLLVLPTALAGSWDEEANRDLSWTDGAISTPQQLAQFAYLVNTGEYDGSDDVYLTQNIDLDGNDWVPIGSKWDGNCIYFGIFDGRGFTISNMTAPAPQDIARSKVGPDELSLYGLFGLVGGDIKNVKVSGSITFASTANPYLEYYYIGSIAGINYGTIFNCVSEVEISIHSESSDSASSLGASYIGGIVGYNPSLVSNCMNYGDIYLEIGNHVPVGGIVGTNYGMIEYCGNYGRLFGTTSAIGGITGNSHDHNDADGLYPSTIQFCYNQGIIEQEVDGIGLGSVQYGGIAGYIIQTSVENCYNTGQVIVFDPAPSNNHNHAGGLVGTHSSGSITNSYFMEDGSISGVGSPVVDLGIKRTLDEMKTKEFIELLNDGVGKFIFNPEGYPLVEPIILESYDDNGGKSKGGSSFGKAQIGKSQSVTPVIDEKPEVPTISDDSGDIDDNDNTDKKESESPGDSGESQNDNNKSNSIFWILGALSIAAVFALVYYFYNKNKN